MNIQTIIIRYRSLESFRDVRYPLLRLFVDVMSVLLLISLGTQTIVRFLRGLGLRHIVVPTSSRAITPSCGRHRTLRLPFLNAIRARPEAPLSSPQNARPLVLFRASSPEPQLRLIVTPSDELIHRTSTITSARGNSPTPPHATVISSLHQSQQH